MSSDAQITERIIRALSHRLSLLDRTDPNFHILGATGNVYTVTISTTTTHSCTFPDRVVPCKHILFVLLRVLCLPLPIIPPPPVLHLASLPTSPSSLAGRRARERFRQVMTEGGGGGGGGARVVEEGEVCPVCLDRMEEEGSISSLVSCGSCGNWLHEECLKKWKRSRGRRAASCVVCRAKWRERREVERYVNLSAYVGDDEGGGWSTCDRR